MDFDLLNRAVARNHGRREALRQRTLERTEKALESLAAEYGIREAYLFGSALHPGRFREQSDVDVAVSDLGKTYWRFLASLSAAVGRDVDLVELDRCRFAARIRRVGRRWTPTS